MQDTKVLTIQDFSSFGQCSVSVALPVISAMGSETVALPVAVLSTHTSEFEDYIYNDLSESLLPAANHIKKYNQNFDLIYTGYLGKTKTVCDVESIIDLFPESRLIVDPAMAESGELYSGISTDYVGAISKLCKKSYLCIPNYTEACMIASVKQVDSPDDQFLTTLCNKLFLTGISNFAVTGVEQGNEIFIILGEKGKVTKLKTTKIQGKFYGAGDVFSSVTVGALAKGLTIKDSISLATDFTQKAVEETAKDSSHWYGLKFEKLLPYLIDKLKKYIK